MRRAYPHLSLACIPWFTRHLRSERRPSRGPTRVPARLPELYCNPCAGNGACVRVRRNRLGLAEAHDTQPLSRGPPDQHRSAACGDCSRRSTVTDRCTVRCSSIRSVTCKARAVPETAAQAVKALAPRTEGSRNRRVLLGGISFVGARPRAAAVGRIRRSQISKARSSSGRTRDFPFIAALSRRASCIRTIRAGERCSIASSGRPSVRNKVRSGHRFVEAPSRQTAFCAQPFFSRAPFWIAASTVTPSAAIRSISACA